MNDSIEKAASRLRFDHLNGETAWQRFMVQVRRHMFRQLLYIGAILLIFFAFTYTFITEHDYLITHLTEVTQVTIVSVLFLLGIFSFWLFFFVGRIMRRELLSLGDPETFAMELEADLSTSNPLRFYKRGVYITRRYLIVESLLTFHLYPIQGLSDCEGIGSIALCYKNNCRLLATPLVHINEFKLLLVPEEEILPPLEPEKSAKKSTILYYFIIVASFALSIAYFILVNLDGEQNFAHALLMAVVFIIAGWVVAVIVFNSKQFKNSFKVGKTLNNTKDSVERLQKIEELHTAKILDTPGYLNQKAIIYEELGNNEQALQCTQEAYHHLSKEILSIGKGHISYYDTFRYNESVFLTNLQRYSEASVILDELDTQGYIGRALYMILMQRARLNLAQNELELAKDYMRRIKTLHIRVPSAQRDEYTYQFMLLEAQCDILEKNTHVALRKIDEVLAHTTWPFTVKRAMELKNSIV